MTVIKVVDLSNYQDKFDFASAKSSGVGGVICQVEVPLYDQHMSAAAGIGLLTGCYRWGLASRNAVDEANRFVDASGPYPMELGYWLDSEVTDGQPPAVVVGFDNAFQRQVQARTSRVPGTYTSPGLWSQIAGDTSDLAWTLLWGADYGVNNLPNFGGWTRHAGWQYTDHAYEGGESVDESWFDLSMLGASPPAHIPEDDMTYPQAIDEKTGGTWTITPDGGCQTDDGAPYLGSINIHPDWHADKPAAASYWRGDGTDTKGNGFKITTQCDTHGTVHYYRFPRDGSLAKPTA